MNGMLIDRYHWRLHTLPAGMALLLSAGLILWYWFASWTTDQWLGGGSVPGLVLGTVAAGIIFFEMGLWPRKMLRRFRLFPTKYWLSAHIWFGLACLPLAIVHSGMHWGGWLSTTLLIVLAATVISGGIGLGLQNVIPRWLLKHIPAETIYEEIDNISISVVRDAETLLNTTCGTRDAAMTLQLNAGEMTRFRELLGDQPEAELTRMIVIGAPREAGRRLEGYQEQPAVANEQQDARSLWNAFDELRPFLLDGSTRARVFGDQARATLWFRLLRQACSPEAERVIDALERLADQRRQFNLQQRLYHWLHGWLPFHIGLSVSLCLLLIAHIYFALRYW
jgi:hypothetical protein